MYDKNAIFLHPVARSLTQSFSSVFVRHCLKHFNLKTLNVHDMFRSLRPSSVVKLWIEEVAVLAFLGFISHICLKYRE
jgi:hypothetical protein